MWFYGCDDDGGPVGETEVVDRHEEGADGDETGEIVHPFGWYAGCIFASLCKGHSSCLYYLRARLLLSSGKWPLRDWREEREGGSQWSSRLHWIRGLDWLTRIQRRSKCDPLFFRQKRVLGVRCMEACNSPMTIVETHVVEGFKCVFLKPHTRMSTKAFRQLVDI